MVTSDVTEAPLLPAEAEVEDFSLNTADTSKIKRGRKENMYVPILTRQENLVVYEQVKQRIVNELINVRTALTESLASVLDTVQIARDPLSIAEQAGVVPDETDVLVAAFGFWKVLKSTIEQGEYDAQVLIAHIDFQTSEILNVTAGVVSKTAAA